VGIELRKDAIRTPTSPQKMYSRVVGLQSGANPSAGKHGRVFETSTITSGGASLTRDNGYSASLDASPIPFLDLGVGYTRSVRYALNTVSFSVGVNVGALAKRNSQARKRIATCGDGSGEHV